MLLPEFVGITPMIANADSQPESGYQMAYKYVSTGEYNAEDTTEINGVEYRLDTVCRICNYIIADHFDDECPDNDLDSPRRFTPIHNVHERLLLPRGV